MFRRALACIAAAVMSGALILFEAAPVSAGIVPGTHTCEASPIGSHGSYRGVVCVDVDLDLSIGRVHARGQALCQSVITGATVQCAGIHMGSFVENIPNNSSTGHAISLCGRQSIPVHDPPCPSTGRLQHLSPGAATHCTHTYKVVTYAYFDLPEHGDKVDAVVTRLYTYAPSGCTLVAPANS